MSYEDLLEKLEAVSIKLESYNDYHLKDINNIRTYRIQKGVVVLCGMLGVVLVESIGQLIN